MQISRINTGFSELPGQITINIYAQGCKLHCAGCQNPDLISFEGGTTFKIQDLDQELQKYELSEWVCWLGGDATYQQDFNEFNKHLKKKNYNICLYTGQLFENIQHLLNDVDIVMDGPWQGIPITEVNTNQRIFIKKQNIWKQIKWNEIKGEIKC